MILNVIIADDEYFIRQRLKKIIPWESLSLHYVGEAENGEEVLTLLKEYVVDIILLDIKMPKMSGMKVAEHIKEHYPHTKIIILSGYNDFEYARSSMHYGVVEYLLKPVEPHILTASLTACISKIEKERHMYSQLNQYHHYELCSNLSNVLNGSMSLPEFKRDFPSFDHYTCCLFVGIFLPTQPESLVRGLTDILRTRQYSCEYWQEKESLYLMQFFFSREEHSATLPGLLHAWQNQDPASWSFLVIGELFPLSDNWKPYYQKVLRGLNQRYFYPETMLLTDYDNKPDPQIKERLRTIRAALVKLLNSRESDQFENYIKTLFGEIHDSGSGEYLSLAIMEIFVTYHMYYQIPASPDISITDFVSSMIDEEYRSAELQDTVISYGLQCMRQSDATPSDVSMSKKIMAFIQEHYQEPDLTVSQIAEFFQLNSSYMGTAFKKVNNLSILQYMTQIRMEASKTLLENSNLKISEVAEKAGYSDVFYFSKKFKKFYGYSPKDCANRRNP